MELVCHQPGKPTVPAADENHGKPFMHVTSDIPGGTMQEDGPSSQSCPKQGKYLRAGGSYTCAAWDI
jgi:hypothetical protein